MRVLHVTRDFPPLSKGGLSTAVGGLVSALTGAGVACDVLSFDGYRPTRGEVEPRFIGVTSPFMPPDVVHVHDALLWPHAAELRARHGVRALYTAHVLQGHQRRLRGLAAPTLSEAAEARALAEADLVTAPSTAAATLLGPEVRVTPLGIHESEPALTAVNARASEVNARVTAVNAGFILFAGRFSDMNGGSELRTVIQRTEYRFVLAGGIPDNPRGERRWRRELEAFGPRVELAGWLAPEALTARYRDAALLIAPSRFETFGQVALEAMLHGVPIVATTAHPLLEHERTALLAPPGDVDTLVALTDRLMGDRPLALRLAAAAAEQARASFLWPRVLPAFLACYERLARA